MTKYASYGDHANLGVQEPEDLYSPRHYACVRSDGRQKRALPLWCYTSDYRTVTECVARSLYRSKRLMDLGI
jgi:hypothetical protein